MKGALVAGKEKKMMKLGDELLPAFFYCVNDKVQLVYTCSWLIEQSLAAIICAQIILEDGCHVQ